MHSFVRDQYTMFENRRIAFLLFSRSPEQEAHFKLLDPSIGRRQNVRLFQALIAANEKMIRNEGLELYCSYKLGITEKQASFGEKLSAAITALFEKGIDQLVVIGNDCPDLNRELLQTVHKQLRAGNECIGPARDGGTYLFSLSKELYNEREFQNLPWQTASLEGALEDYLRTKGCIPDLLPVLEDLDSQADLHRFLRSHDPHNFIYHLIKSFRTHRFITAFRFFIQEDIPGQWRSMRAPPAIR